MEDKVLALIVGVWLVQLLWLPVVGLLAMVFKWIIRCTDQDKYRWGSSIYARLYPKKDIYEWSGKVDIDFIGFWLTVHGCIPIAIILVLGNTPPEVSNILFWVFVVATGVPIVLRFLVDICRNLKLNSKTGEAERISELERKVEELTRK